MPKLNRLSNKQIEYLKHRTAGSTKRDAVKRAYNVSPTASNKSLDNMASAIEKSPLVLEVLESMNEQAQDSIRTVLEHSTEFSKSGDKTGALYATVALQASNSVLDRIHGKAKQSIDIQSTSVNLNIDLTMGD